VPVETINQRWPESLSQTPTRLLSEMSTDQNWIRTEANFVRIRTGSDWKNFCCFVVIILTTPKMLVVMSFYRFVW